MESIFSIIKSIFRKAYLLYSEGNFLESISLISKTNDIWIDTKEKFKFLFLLGYNYYKLNDYDRAERILLESLALCPGNVKILDLLGNLYFKMENYKESMKYYKIAKKEDILNFILSLKIVKIYYKLNEIDKMFRTLKFAYKYDFVGEKEKKELKKFLIDFLNNSNYSNSYSKVKKFREWCYRIKKNKKR